MWRPAPNAGRPAAAITALTLACSTLYAAPARAQEGARLEVLRQPLWHEAEDSLGLKLRITNEDDVALNGFQLIVAVSSRVETRSALHDLFDAGSSVPTSSFPVASKRTIAPGEGATVDVDEPLSTLVLLSQTSEGGVYPLTVTLSDATGTQTLDAVTTPLIYYPSTPDPPLNLVPVLPINDAAARDPSGVFSRDESERVPLERALDEGGWMHGILRALDEHAGSDVHIGLAPTPRLVEELADMANGYRRFDAEGSEQRVPADAASARQADDWLRSFTEILARRGTQEMLVPYSFPDLPALAEELGPLAVQEEITLAEEIVRDTLDADFSRRALFAPAARLDAETLDQLKLANAADLTLFVQESLEQSDDPASAGCPEPTLTFACTVAVETAHGTTRGYEADAGLQLRLARLSEPGDQRTDMQNFFAETAMIREELPGVSDRVVHVTIPSLWHPTPRAASFFFRGLARAPWLHTWTPAEGLREGAESADRAITNDLPATRVGAGDAYYDAVSQAADLVEHYGSVAPPESKLQRLERNVLVAHSRNWWTPEGLTRGEEFASRTTDEIEDEFAKVTIGGVGEITLTSRRGEIQVPLFIDTGYPVKLQVRVNPLELDITPRSVVDTFDQPSAQLTFDAVAKSSGAFPLEVSVETPDDFVIAQRTLSIRSTRFNQIAVGITFGALAFLVLFYVVRGVRKRRHRPPPSTADAS